MNQIIIYQNQNGDTKIDVKVGSDTVWLTLNQMSDLFDKNKSTISRHLNNIYEEEKLIKEATVAKNATAQTEGDGQIIKCLKTA